MDQSLAVKVIFKRSRLKMRASINSVQMDSSCGQEGRAVMVSSDQLCKAQSRVLLTFAALAANVTHALYQEAIIKHQEAIIKNEGIEMGKIHADYNRREDLDIYNLLHFLSLRAVSFFSQLARSYRSIARGEPRDPRFLSIVCIIYFEFRARRISGTKTDYSQSSISSIKCRVLINAGSGLTPGCE